MYVIFLFNHLLPKSTQIQTLIIIPGAAGAATNPWNLSNQFICFICTENIDNSNFYSIN